MSDNKYKETFFLPRTLNFSFQYHDSKGQTIYVNDKAISFSFKNMGHCKVNCKWQQKHYSLNLPHVMLFFNKIVVTKSYTYCLSRNLGSFLRAVFPNLF
jgi:hypothetical protein